MIMLISVVLPIYFVLAYSINKTRRIKLFRRFLIFTGYVFWLNMIMWATGSTSIIAFFGVAAMLLSLAAPVFFWRICAKSARFVKRSLAKAHSTLTEEKE